MEGDSVMPPLPWPGLLAGRPNAIPALVTAPPQPAPEIDVIPEPEPGYVGKRRAGRRSQAVGQHRPDTVRLRQVDVSHLLSPAAQHLVAPTRDDEMLPAGPDDATGLYDPAAIQALREGAR